MKQSTYIISLLEKYWPDECDAAGDTNINDIVEGDVVYESAKGGSYIDLELVITVLVGATEFIKNTISIYKYLKEKYGKPPTHDEIENELSKKESIESSSTQEEIPPETKQRVIESVCQDLDNENNSE